MTKEVKLTVTAPTDCTDEQFQEWVEYCTGNRASISMNNPLHEYDMDADNVEID